MSVEEDTELRDLISQTLEANGCFAKIRAQLRASVYLALDEDDAFQKNDVQLNKKLHSTLESNEGKLMFCIVREFLEQFNLEFTISVFEPESYIGSNYEYIGRQKLIQDLNIPGVNQESPDSVLLQLMQLCKLSNRSDENTENSVSSLNYKNDLLSQSNCNDSSVVTVANDSNISTKSIYNSTHFTVLNETYDVEKDLIKMKDETLSQKYENSSKTIEPSVTGLKEKMLVDFNKSVTLETIVSKSDLEKNKSFEDFSPPIVKDIKQHPKLDTSFEKLKLPLPKGDKNKVKNNLSSLSDLPPLQITKARTNDMLLPSLYTKEFKDRSNVKDSDKLFELEPMDNYEEDFMSESELDLTLHKPEDIAKTDIFRGSQHENSDENEIKPEDTTKSNGNTSSRVHETSDKRNLILDSNSTGSSVTSEDFEISSNVDDVLNFC